MSRLAERTRRRPTRAADKRRVRASVASRVLGRARPWSRIAALPAAALATFALAGCGGDKATLATFTGTCQAHARSLKIARTGNAQEWFSLGLGHFVIALRFHLSRPRGTPHDATATVTAVRPGDRSACTAAHPLPRVGESRTIRLRDGVITETLTGAHYCSTTARQWTTRQWLDAGCGA